MKQKQKRGGLFPLGKTKMKKYAQPIIIKITNNREIPDMVSLFDRMESCNQRDVKIAMGYSISEYDDLLDYLVSGKIAYRYIAVQPVKGFDKVKHFHIEAIQTTIRGSRSTVPIVFKKGRINTYYSVSQGIIDVLVRWKFLMPPFSEMTIFLYDTPNPIRLKTKIKTTIKK